MRSLCVEKIEKSHWPKKCFDYLVTLEADGHFIRYFGLGSCLEIGNRIGTKNFFQQVAEACGS
jgi:hypothetical protein